MLKQMRLAGFTIVELLVVIVVIGILATVVFVAFSNASQRAITASLQADLNGGKKLVEAFYATNGVYPTANNCTNTLTTEVCLKPSSGNTFTYTTATFNGQTTYSLTATRGSTSSTVTGGSIPSIVTDGLVLNLDAGNTASYPGTGTTWTDLSGSGNNGTLVNGPTYSSANGGSIVFDGVDDAVSINSISLSGDFSIFFCENLQGTISNNQGVVGLSGGGNDINHYAGYMRYYAPGDLVVNTQITTQNTWYCYALTRSVGTYNIYSNAQLTATNTGSITTFTITRIAKGNAGSLNGRLALVQIYSNKALTQAEVNQNFYAVRSRFGI